MNIKGNIKITLLKITNKLVFIILFYDIITLHCAFFVLIFVGDLDGADGLWSL